MPDLKIALSQRSKTIHSLERLDHSERLVVYGAAALSASAGLGLFTAIIGDNAELGAAVGGLGLCVSAIALISRLNTNKSDTPRQSKQDAELIRYLIDSAWDATLITNSAGELIASNERYDLMGAERRRPVASLLDLVGSDKIISKFIQTVNQQGQNVEVFPSKRLDLGDIEVTATPRGSHLLWQFRPQASSIRAKAIIHKLQENIEPILNQMELGLALIDKQGDFLHANGQLRSWLQLEDGQSLPVKLRLKDHATRLVVDEGNILDVHIISMPVSSGEEAEEFGEFLIIRNLEGFAGSRHKSAVSNDLIDPLVDAAPIGVVVIDETGTVEDMNQRMELFGQSLGIEKYNNIFELLLAEYHLEFRKLLERVAAGQVVRRPYDVRFKGEGDKVGQFYFSSIKTDDKRFIILYMIDTSHQKSIEKQFVQAQKMQAVGQLAGGVAHDFNNLLTAIIGFCDLSLARHEAGDTTFSDLMNIKQNANRASNLVRQLLAFSRQQTLRPKVLSISDVIAELSNLLRRLIGENITLEVKHGRDLSPVKVDQGQLEQVIINLAVNAKDAMPHGGTLTISTRTLKSNDPLLDRFDVIVPSDYVLVELRDTGTGIDEKDAGQIFDPFFTTKDVGKGTGLGLATVYGIVKQTGGYVFFDSELGKGTNFMIFLKAHQGEEEADEDIEEEKPVLDLTGQGTILLVEDEDAVRLFTTRALTNKGYKVLQATTGEEGLELYLENADDIKLLITDVIMPVMDGPTLVKEAKKTNKDLKVIFISGYAEDVVRQDIQDDSCHFLPKPFSLNELAKTVKTIL